MPMMNFDKSGKATIVVFDQRTGKYERIEKQVTPGDVYEVALEDMERPSMQKLGKGAERQKWEKMEALREADRIREAKRELREADRRRHETETNERLDALENG